MQLVVAGPVKPRKLGLLPGSFNPPTRAHIAMAEAALATVDEVLLVLPDVFPHKPWEGATQEQRLQMLRLIAQSRPQFGVAVTEGGLFAEIAREARELYADAELYILCGRDAAERMIAWDYGATNPIVRQLEHFQLLVAPRGGRYEPPAHVAHAVHTLSLDFYDECASTRVRERSGRWRDLVPDEIAHLVETIY
jgi:nicotinate (nicotinamide) nucleotide adenylyltransferase